MPFLPQAYDNDYRWVESIIPPGGSQVVQFLAPNVNRIMLLLSVITGTVEVGLSNNIAAGQGIPVSAGNSPLIWDYSTFANLVGKAWFLVQPSSVALYIIEVIAIGSTE